MCLHLLEPPLAGPRPPGGGGEGGGGGGGEGPPPPHRVEGHQAQHHRHQPWKHRQEITKIHVFAHFPSESS